MKLRLITLLLFISSVAFGQTNYLQVGNTLYAKDTTINSVTQKTYRTYKGSTGYEYFPTRGWVLAQSWAISRITGLQDSLSNKYSKSDADARFANIDGSNATGTWPISISNGVYTNASNVFNGTNIFNNITTVSSLNVNGTLGIGGGNSIRIYRSDNLDWATIETDASTANLILNNQLKVQNAAGINSIFPTTGDVTDIGTGDFKFRNAYLYGGVISDGFPKFSAATSGRVPYFTTAGQMTDDADLTFNGTNLSVVAPASGSHVVNKTYADATYAPISITGNVTGPASSIDNEIPRFDGSTGKILQNSGVYIADGGSISTESSISSSGGLSSFANVQNQGQQYQAKTTITSGSYSVVNDYTIFANAVSGDITVNLPASSSNSGRILVIKKTDPSGNTVTIDGNSSETIDGDTTYVLVSQYNGVQIQSDGLNWYVIGFF